MHNVHAVKTRCTFGTILRLFSIAMHLLNDQYMINIGSALFTTELQHVVMRKIWFVLSPSRNTLMYMLFYTVCMGNYWLCLFLVTWAAPQGPWEGLQWHESRSRPKSKRPQPTAWHQGNNGEHFICVRARVDLHISCVRWNMQGFYCLYFYITLQHPTPLLGTCICLMFRLHHLRKWNSESCRRNNWSEDHVRWPSS